MRRGGLGVGGWLPCQRPHVVVIVIKCRVKKKRYSGIACTYCSDLGSPAQKREPLSQTDRACSEHVPLVSSSILENVSKVTTRSSSTWSSSRTTRSGSRRMRRSRTTATCQARSAFSRFALALALALRTLLHAQVQGHPVCANYRKGAGGSTMLHQLSFWGVDRGIIENFKVLS